MIFNKIKKLHYLELTNKIKKYHLNYKIIKYFVMFQLNYIILIMFNNKNNILII